LPPGPVTSSASLCNIEYKRSTLCPCVWLCLPVRSSRGDVGIDSHVAVDPCLVGKFSEHGRKFLLALHLHMEPFMVGWVLFCLVPENDSPEDHHCSPGFLLFIATILIFSACIWLALSSLKLTSFMMNVHTSSQKR
jgi:hypothetical protein